MTAAPSLSDRPVPPGTRWHLGWRHLLVILVAAFATRALQFGNPIVQIDEQFYLLAGDRLLHGALPFVDIWDRKPFGLFLIYAGIRSLGGAGIVEYQIVATLFAAATAIVIARIARRLAHARGATIAGLVYLVFLLSSGGDGGQAPVFYDLPLALAALLLVKMQERPTADARALGLVALAMTLLGVALQIKYSVLFEGVFFGLYALVALRRRGVSYIRLVSIGVACCVIALVPTVLVFLLYWSRGFTEQFVFANFTSVFLRSGDGLDVPRRLLVIGAHIALPLAAAIWGATRTVENRAAHRFVIIWSAVALAGVLAFGTYHAHYALPLFVPLAIAGAPIYGVRLGIGRYRLLAGHVVVAIGLVAGIATMVASQRKHGTGAAVEAAARIIGRNPPGCIFVFSGDPILYHLTDSCLPTPFLFPTFLSETRDSVSLGRDPIAEIRSVMTRRPAYVITRDRPPRDALRPAWAVMDRLLTRDYTLAFRERKGHNTVLGYRLNGASAR